MRYKLMLAFLIAGHLSFCQTDKHIKVPGTKCSLVPPTGFKASAKFSGFQNEETGASIMISEIPGPYQEIVEGFTEENLKKRGMVLLSKENIDFNKSKATFVNLTQDANGTTYIKQILIFGDANETVMVNGIYPEISKSHEAEIKAALMSTVFNPSLNVSPLDAVPFTIDVDNTEFKVAKFIAGGLIYSTDGKIPTNKPSLIVSSSIAKVTAPNRKQYAIERLKKLPGCESSVVKEIWEIAVDHLKGYEIVADKKTSGGKGELVYQVMLFDDKGDYYIIVGQANENQEKNLATYKKIARTFKLKG